MLSRRAAFRQLPRRGLDAVWGDSRSSVWWRWMSRKVPSWMSKGSHSLEQASSRGGLGLETDARPALW